jgi:hypothetical protein
MDSNHRSLAKSRGSRQVDILQILAGRPSGYPTVGHCGDVRFRALVKGSMAWLLCLPVGQASSLASSCCSTLFLLTRPKAGLFGEGPTVRIRFPPAESLVRTRQHPSVPAQLGADASGCGRKNRTFASFGEYDPLRSIEHDMFEIRSRPIGNGCSGQISKSRYVAPGAAATRRFPIVAHRIHAIIAPSITSVARRCERVVVRHLHQLVQLPSPNAHVPAIEQR